MAYNKLKRFIESKYAQKQADRENYVPGILIGREEMEEFIAMTPEERKEKVKDFNRRLAESNLVGPPHRMLDDEC